MYAFIIHTESAQSNSALTNTTQNSATQDSFSENSKTVEIYDLAKENIEVVTELSTYFYHKLGKKITVECKMRVTVFKESEAKKYDENISALSKKAVDHILKAERCLNLIRKMKGSNLT